MGAAIWTAILAAGAAPAAAYDTLAALAIGGSFLLQILALVGTRRAIAAER